LSAFIIRVQLLHFTHFFRLHVSLPHNNRERFHPFAPGTHLHWKPPGENEEEDWYEEYNKEWGILQGKDCCAPDSVSFHYVKKASMVRHMHALINECSTQ
jgi:hypothetical protein